MIVFSFGHTNLLLEIIIPFWIPFLIFNSFIHLIYFFLGLAEAYFHMLLNYLLNLWNNLTCSSWGIFSSSTLSIPHFHLKPHPFHTPSSVTPVPPFLFLNFVRFVGFDIAFGVDNIPFERRYKLLLTNSPTSSPMAVSSF